MKKKISSSLCILLALMMLLTAAPLSVLAQETDQEINYIDSIEKLNTYLMANPEKPIDLKILNEQFLNLASYKCSTEFWLYTEILAALEAEDFTTAQTYASMLEFYFAEGEPFWKLFNDPTFSNQYSYIRPIGEMKTYINGRIKEKGGDNAAAMQTYGTCLKFFDARLRFLQLQPDLDALYKEGLECIRSGDYEKALDIAKTLQDHGYDKGDSLYKMANFGLSDQETPPTATPAPLSGDWSSWSATKPDASSNIQVEEKKQYRYRTLSTNKTQQWSNWSSWSETAISETSTRQVETKNETKTNLVTKYRYSRWRYYNETYGIWFTSYTEYTGSGYQPGSGSWQYKTTTEPLNNIGFTDGHKQYEGNWYNQEVIKENTENTTTYYRYRTLNEETTTTWSGFSAWQDEPVDSSATREVQTRTVYRYRTLK